MNTYITLMYVFLSAIAYACAFIFNDTLWFAIFLFPLPLFHAAIHSSLSFLHGYFFGYASIGFILYDTLLTIINMAAPNGSWTRIIPALALIFYLPLYAGVFFSIANRFCRRFSLSATAKLITWALVFIVYFYCMDHYSFWIFDYKEGCFLLHPTLTLANQPLGLYLAHIIGKVGITLLILIPALLIMLSNIHAPKYTHINALSLLLFIIGCAHVYIPTSTQKPAYIDELVYIPLTFSSHYCPEKIIRKIERICTYSLERYPNARCFLFPESSIYNAAFFADTILLQKLSKKYVGKKITLVSGSFRIANNSTYNTCFVVHNGIQLHYHDKQHLMPLIERIPSWFNAEFIIKNYFPMGSSLCYGSKPNPLISLTKNLDAVPYLCSELFCHEYPLDTHAQTPIVALCNDRWFSYTYTKKLMIASAKLKAAFWNRPIIYISYLAGLFLDPQGAVYHIPSYCD